MLAERIKAIHTASRGTYGWPRVHPGLRRDGVAVSGKRVARIMREHAVVGRCRRRFTTTTVSDPHAAAVDLVKRVFGPGTVEVDRVYVGDITFHAYYAAWRQGAAIVMGEAWRLASPLSLSALAPGLRAPQSYRYLQAQILDAVLADATVTPGLEPVGSAPYRG